MKKTTFAMAVATANAVSLEKCACNGLTTTLGGSNIIMPGASTITTRTGPFGARKTTIVRSISPMPARQIVNVGYEQPLTLVNYNKSNLGLGSALDSRGAEIIALGNTRYISPASRTILTRSVSATRDFQPIGSTRTLFGPKVISMGGQRDSSIITIASTDSLLGARRVVRAVSLEQPGAYATRYIRTPSGAVVHRKSTSVTKGLGGRVTAKQTKYTNKGLGRWATTNTSIERGFGKTLRAKSSSLERGFGGALKYKTMSVERDAFGNIISADKQQTLRGPGAHIVTNKSINRGFGATIVRDTSFTRGPATSNVVYVQEPANILDQNVLLGGADYRYTTQRPSAILDQNILLGGADYRYTTQRPSAIILDSDSAFGRKSFVSLGMACSDSDSASSNDGDLGALFEDQNNLQMIETNLGAMFVTPQGKYYYKKPMAQDCDEDLGGEEESDDEESDDEGFGGQECVCPGATEDNQCFCSCPSQDEDGNCQLNNYMMGESDVQDNGTLLAQTEAGHGHCYGNNYCGSYGGYRNRCHGYARYNYNNNWGCQSRACC